MNPVDLAFEVFGNPEAAPLIILHGFLASSRNWRSIAKQLAEHHYVYVLDMRNHGASPHAENMDYPAMACDVLWFMNVRGIEKAHVLGHSMGGKVAMWFSLAYPNRLGKLMIADIAPVSYDHSFSPMIQTLKQLPLDQLANRKQAEQYLSDQIPDAAFRQFLLQNLLLKNGVYYWRINLDILERTAHHIVGFPSDAGEETFASPALFIVGEHSSYVEPGAVFTKFPKAEIVEIPGTSHWLYVEAPDEFCKLINAWIFDS